MTTTFSDEENAELLDRVAQRASAYEYEFGGCGQMVLLALQQEFKLAWNPAVFKAVTFVGRGTGGLGGTCGALVGGVLALGLASGRDALEDSIYPNPDDKDPETGFPKSLELIKQYYRRFSQEMGSSNCLEIIALQMGKHYNPTIKSEAEQFMSNGGKERCNDVVGKVARLTAEFIMQIPRR